MFVVGKTIYDYCAGVSIIGDLLGETNSHLAGWDLSWSHPIHHISRSSLGKKLRYLFTVPTISLFVVTNR